jgi:hypothetical protein
MAKQHSVVIRSNGTTYPELFRHTSHITLMRRVRRHHRDMARFLTITVVAKHDSVMTRSTGLCARSGISYSANNRQVRQLTSANNQRWSMVNRKRYSPAGNHCYRTRIRHPPPLLGGGVPPEQGASAVTRPIVARTHPQTFRGSPGRRIQPVPAANRRSWRRIVELIRPN